jgi:uncharacterized damage-inducible protein DinB
MIVSSMDPLAHFTVFARYNRWANRRLRVACDGLTDAEWRADRGAFFGSLQGTLNHLLVADRIWMRRLTGTGDAPDRLDAILFEDRDALAAAREREDARILAHVEGMASADLAATLRYATLRGETFEQPVSLVLAHVFNHQAHHRGQAHAILTGLGHEAPPLDLLYYLREA